MKILLLDIETAPNKVYTWGLFKQDISINQIEEPGYTLCWAAKWYRDPEVMFASVFKHGRPEMLRRIHALLDEADVVVHYNGTKFDIPVLNQEFLKEGFSPPSPSLQIDLLKVARSRFRLASNKLDYVAGFLGLGRKLEHKGMDLWRECMQGVADAWATMESYNKRDTTLLEKVYDKLLPWIPNHPNHALFNETEEVICPNCGSDNVQKRGFSYTKTMKYQRYQCQNCGSWHRARTTVLPLEKRKAIIQGIS